ncbi:protein of unknown function (plasmid) [Streptantibioticus cattleyicolor NRRL 8057 = DSM 46488]|nr:protein of unknown function [Streptantibioticus cattleyicolor NRRL 8057 = DSM 46488]
MPICEQESLRREVCGIHARCWSALFRSDRRVSPCGGGRSCWGRPRGRRAAVRRLRPAGTIAGRGTARRGGSRLLGRRASPFPYQAAGVHTRPGHAVPHATGAGSAVVGVAPAGLAAAWFALFPKGVPAGQSHSAPGETPHRRRPPARARECALATPKEP